MYHKSYCFTFAHHNHSQPEPFSWHVKFCKDLDLVLFLQLILLIPGHSRIPQTSFRAQSSFYPKLLSGLHSPLLAHLKS